MPLIIERFRALDWRWGWLGGWLLFAVWLLWIKWGAIHWFALGDTDDNLRMAQVRALIEGQGWFDLRQYKLGLAGAGLNIHWSRLVDLPIAGLYLAAKPFIGGAPAEKFAVAVAPLLPLGLALFALMLTARRLVDRNAWPVAAALLACTSSALLSFAPLRIDHHGWQLAFLALMVAGSADRDRFRGGLTTGVATALSLVVGLELLPYLALGGALTVLAWVRDEAAAPRLRGYGLALAGGCALGYAAFASTDNRAAVCDVLSPVYLSTMLAAGALVVLLSHLKAARWTARLGLASVAGTVLAGGFVAAWPHCLGRPEAVSPELERNWLRFVNEARPIWMQGYKRYVPLLAFAMAGTLGSLLAAWRHRRDERVMSWASVAMLSFVATGLLFWQTRASAAAQLLAVPGSTWLAWQAGRWALAQAQFWRGVIGGTAVWLLATGLGASWLVASIPDTPASKARKSVNLANRRCPTLPALAPINQLPATTILTFVDLGPRLITVTHHRAIAGPYHRNGEAILDVQRSFRSESPDVARGVMRKYGADLLLICPGLSESTLYSSQNPKGFYRQLVAGQVPAWLEPVPLPEKSPFKLWRLRQ